MSYTITEKPHIGQGMGVRAYIGFNGRYHTDKSAPHSNVMCVRRSGDGCIGIDISKRYLYPQEAEAVYEALGKLIRDYKNEKAAARERWLRETADNKVYFGIGVDLSRNETITALAGESRSLPDRVQVLYEGRWLDVFRIDLKDDIGTYMSGAGIEHYRAKAQTCYGARLRNGGIGIVDAFSDG